MSKKLVVCVALAALTGIRAAAEAGVWGPAPNPLMTRWAKDVSPKCVHPEYPRPQMVRKAWLNLNGLWQLAIAEKEDIPPTGSDLPERILVPFPVESALSGLRKRVSRVWYRRTFEVPRDWRGRRVLLHFGAVDWEATVYVNGLEFGLHRGGYDAFTFDITDALRPTGPQEIVVGVFDPTSSGDQPRGKQVDGPKGIWYTPTTGIWQTVWLEPVPQASIGELSMIPDVDAGCLRLIVTGRGTTDEHTVEAVASAGGRRIAGVSGRLGSELRFVIPNPKLWGPDDPFLYGLRVSLRKGRRIVDEVESYFGMRKVVIGRDEDGVTRILLNGKPTFQIGFLDQGFWPDGLYTAPTDEALRYDIEITKKLGMNMARKHVKIEPDRWYYWCDRLGLLVWQDMPNGNNRTPESRGQFRRELRRLVEGRRNHPSIVMWVVFNEGWGQHDTERLTAWVKELDPGRLVSCASGWTDKGVGDVHDIHKYPGPASPNPEPTRAAVLGEFGGLGLGVDGHTWAKKHWGYRGTASSEDLTRRYVGLLRKVWALAHREGLSAAVYTQTTDVETECNGLVTYDRAIVKVDIDRVASANRGLLQGNIPPPPEIKVVVPTSEKEPHTWRYTTREPAATWSSPGFDDSGWKQGPAGFGTRGTPGAVVRTEWRSGDIWIRRPFNLPTTLAPTSFTDLHLRMHHDEDAHVYLNGVLAAATRGYTTGYEEFAVSPEATAALKRGGNVLAVHCRQTVGGQYIDVGLVDLVPPKR